MTNERVVVDGSNIATEGRTTPSLAQLDEAVRALMEEYPEARITVVVDATFGHRIDPGESEAYEEGVLAGELVSPPAGAIGRGDAFVLQIADKADATVFSNDSFQEFHGQYDWLFTEGRLLGGKPVPDVGWIFVLRTPVRGPTSRRATREARSTTTRPAAKVAAAVSAPADAGTDKAEVKGAGGRGGRRRRPSMAGADVASVVEADPTAAPADGAGVDVAGEGEGDGGRRRRRPAAAAGEPVNDPVTFLHFVSDHPVGATVEGVVDRFSSHGAYVVVGEAQCYIPLRSMAEPPPTSAKQVLTVGETRRFTVDAFNTPRRSIDLVVPGVEQIEAGAETPLEAEPPTQPVDPVGPDQPDAEEAHTMAVGKRTTATKAAAKKAPAKKAAAKAPASKVAASAVKKATTVAKKATTAAKKATTTAAKKATTAAKAPATKTAAKAPAKKATATKAAAKRAPAKKVAAKAPSKKAIATKAATKKAPAKRAAAKKAT